MDDATPAKAVVAAHDVAAGRVSPAVDEVSDRIVVVRGRRVLLDVDVAMLYGVSLKRLNEQVKRGRNLKYAPYAFTEHGAVMLAAVLNSPVAIDASIQVVRAFVRLRALVAAHEELAQKLDAMEQKFDRQFLVVFDAIRQLMAPPTSSAARIGFRRPEGDATPDDRGDAE